MKIRALEGVRPFHRRILARTVPLDVYDRLYAGEQFAFLYESLESDVG